MGEYAFGLGNLTDLTKMPLHCVRSIETQGNDYAEIA